MRSITFLTIFVASTLSFSAFGGSFTFSGEPAKLLGEQYKKATTDGTTFGSVSCKQVKEQWSCTLTTKAKDKSTLYLVPVISPTEVTSAGDVAFADVETASVSLSYLEKNLWKKEGDQTNAKYNSWRFSASGDVGKNLSNDVYEILDYGFDSMGSAANFINSDGPVKTHQAGGITSTSVTVSNRIEGTEKFEDAYFYTLVIKY